MAAEYHSGLCEALAQAYQEHGTAGTQKPEHIEFNEAGVHDPLATEDGKQRRERENRECIGGMRNPSSSVKKVPGWSDAGTILKNVLEPIVEDNFSVFEKLLTAVGSEEAKDIPSRL